MMKYLYGMGMIMHIRRISFVLLPLFLLAFSSCDPQEDRLGIDILPPSDSISVYTDTIFDFETSLTKAMPLATSVNKNSLDNEREYLLGSMTDTAFGKSRAEILTQFNIFNEADFGENPVIDSVVLWLYVNGVEGDSARPMQLSVYESQDQLFYDSNYYHTYVPEGNYSQPPLVDQQVTFVGDSTYEFVIEDQDFYNKIVSAATDSVFVSDSLMKTLFYGLYLTTGQVADGGALAKIQMAAPSSRLGFRYLPDSISLDTAEYEDYDWYWMRFDESNAQKVNMFTHDYTGTALEGWIDNPDADISTGYVQGMGGVNMKIRVPGFDDWLEGERVAINKARLVFEVLPDSVSGIATSNYPQRTMLVREIGEDEQQVVYDYMINSSSSSGFGKLTRFNPVSAFLEPTYQYPFNLMRHFQSVINDEIGNDTFVLRMYNPTQTGKFIKVKSNQYEGDGRLRLELIYSRL